MIDHGYPIAIGGTQKLVRHGRWWGAQWLERHYASDENETSVQQYVYVLEANLVRPKGLTFMIVLPDQCLPSIWEDVNALRPRTAHHDRQVWHGRQQCFWWVNEITYVFDNGQRQPRVHVVGCKEIGSKADADSAEVVDQYTLALHKNGH